MVYTLATPGRSIAPYANEYVEVIEDTVQRVADHGRAMQLHKAQGDHLQIQAGVASSRMEVFHGTVLRSLSDSSTPFGRDKNAKIQVICETTTNDALTANSAVDIYGVEGGNAYV